MAVLAFSGYPRLARAVLLELLDALEKVESAGLFSGVVITSRTESFSAGADVEEIRTVEGHSGRQFAELGQRTCRRIEDFSLPVVAAIRGYCLGGGLDLALACHGRVATYDASFAHPGAALGLVTGWGGTQRLPRLVGKAAALEMFLTAERIPATQALSMGLVDALVPSRDLIASAAKRAETLRPAPWAGFAGD